MRAPETIEAPRECVLKDSGKCVGWVCMGCNGLYRTAIYACRDDLASEAARQAAARCCAEKACHTCGGEVGKYRTICNECIRKRDEAKFDGAQKLTIAAYREQHADGMVTDGENFWTVDSYVDDEVYLTHPRVWFCEPRRGIELDAEDLLENWADDRHEDAVDDLDVRGLQALLDEWCAKQKTCSWFDSGKALDQAEVARMARERAADEHARDETEGE